MATNKKLSDLPEWTTPPVSGDKFLILPSSETVQHYWIDKDIMPGGSSANITRESFTSAATSGDGQDTGVDITSTPAGSVTVLVDGIEVNLTGDKLDDCYFSSDGGSTAKALSAIVAGDSLYWNGAINAAKSIPIVFGDLTTNDRITLIY